MTQPFIGEIKMVGFNFAPQGWAFCNGTLISISQNSAMFSLLGTIYGGDGETTFALPDLRGRVPIHFGSGPGLPTFTQGQRSGTVTNTLIVSQLPSHNHSVGAHTHPQAAHTHPVKASSGVGTQASPQDNYWAQSSEDVVSYNTTSNVTMNSDAVGSEGGDDTGDNTNFNTGSIGGGQSVNNMPPYLVINFIIALVGIFPSE